MKPKRLVRAMVLTSIRDVGRCDLNGCMVPTKSGPRYMEGLIERTVRECNPGGELDGVLEIAGVVTDDLASHLEGSAYPLTPRAGMQWIHPLDLADRHGRLIAAATVNEPSLFRRVPKSDEGLRRGAKREFEAKLLAHMRDMGADIIVSDHYMARIEFLIGEFGLYGKVLNIHPAITDKRHPCCFRGPTPTMDAINRARSGETTVTGATLHIVNADFDDGPIIEIAWPTPVYPSDSPVELRHRNYQLAKLPVFIRGIKKYITEML